METTPLPDPPGNSADAGSRELTILNAIARELNRPVDLSESLRTALGLVAQLLGLRTGWIFLLDEENESPYLAASQNLPPALMASPDWMDGSCFCLDTYRAGDLGGAANVNVVRCSRLKWFVDGTDGLRYHASIPLYAVGKKIGVLNVASTDWRKLSEADLRILYTVGDLLSIAIERSRLFARTAELGAAEERNRLAREIHDTLAQGLAGIALKLEMADALIERGNDTERMRDAVRQALELARHNLEEARRSVLDLRAATLEGKTLCEALTLLAERWHADGNPTVTLDLVGTHRPLEQRLEIGLYRIAQEALTNIARHAAARHVVLRLHLTPEYAEMTIEDDGRGFEPYRAIKGHHGLVGMNERARMLNGWLNVQSAPGEGTSVSVKVPAE
ncbi:MAG TPA: GAF domain-containing sensor histidine kinase [Candidatus Kapabacteria bacterium]|nr:GAF domain-containing sensor histidine kinase [Candidatus Kapabacteria bacterium]